VFPNFWQPECSGGARRRAWKQSGLRQTLNATVSKVDNLVWLPRARKNENWSRGPTIDEFCAGTCTCQLRFYGDRSRSYQSDTGTHRCQFSAGTHGCPPKIGDPRLTQRGPRVDLRPLFCGAGYTEGTCSQHVVYTSTSATCQPNLHGKWVYVGLNSYNMPKWFKCSGSTAVESARGNNQKRYLDWFRFTPSTTPICRIVNANGQNQNLV
jgi:hypothetical protein